MHEEANRIAQNAVDIAIAERGEVGLQVAAYLGGELVVDAWGGLADPGTGRAVDGETLFCPFSVTKAITAVALHIQIERGLVELAAPIARYWPGFGVHGKDRATIYDVLTHRVGLPFMPADVTPELMCDWDWMTTQLANMHPLYPPGTGSSYLALTFGWLVGEVVRRTDPRQRRFGQFVQEEICAPLGIDSLWLGIPEAAIGRVARVIAEDRSVAGGPGYRPDNWRALVHPSAVGPFETVYGRRDVMQACLPAAGGLMNARSCARFFAMLSGRGELGSVRLLSEDLVATFHIPKPPSDWDFSLGTPHPGTIGGFWVKGSSNMQPVGAGRYTFGHPGSGGSIGWADPERDFAMAIFHNRLFQGGSTGSAHGGQSFVMIADAVRSALGI